MAIRLYATESVAWRVIGLVDSSVHAPSYTRLDAAREFAAECAMVKVHASEALGFIADEGVQIHGGYGYHRDYFVERAYRDARIYRIFEGTNEINRFVVMKTLLKRASRGDSALIARAVNVARELTAHHGSTSDEAADDPIAAARRLFLAVLGVAVDTRGADLDGDQVLLAALADMAIELFAMESSSLRAATLSTSEGAADMAAVIVSDGLRRVETSALAVVSGWRDVGGSLRQKIRALDAGSAIDGAGLRQRIAERLLARAAHPA
jgi:alkylation response protein AidB-like acyl-CoA dehydrogenase